MKVGCVVEGHGEVGAIRGLVTRIAQVVAPGVHVEVLAPIRVKRQKVVQTGELERHVALLGDRVGAGGALLVLLDADDDCAATLGPELLQRARTVRADRRISVVFAVREYEAWFLAALPSLAGRRGFPSEVAPVADPDGVRSPKGRMPERYSETVDQPALTAAMDLELARRSPSFDKLYREIRGWFTP